MIRTYCDRCGKMDGACRTEITISPSGSVMSRYFNCDLCAECREILAILIKEAIWKTMMKA
jgi:hypothetical protein